MENRAEYLLESYFANALTAVEAKELKTLLAADPGVAAEFAFQQNIAASAQLRPLSAGIQNTVWRTAAQKPFPTTAIKTSMWPRYAYAAAAAIALLIVGYLFLMPPNLQTLVAENAIAFPNNLSYKNLAGETSGFSPEAINALSLYDKGNYTEASLALESIVRANADRMDYRFYWGVSLVQNKQYSEAVTALTPVTQSQSDQAIPAQLFLGFACAGAGDKDCARTNLQAYINAPQADPKRKKQAKTVLEAL